MMEQTAETFVVIDGAAVPRGIYDAVKAEARAAHAVRFIGFVYTRPMALAIALDDSSEERNRKNSEVRRQERSGENCFWIIGLTRDELQARFGSILSMVLWIGPNGD